MTASFRLISCKFAFQPCDITETEANIWIKHIIDEVGGEFISVADIFEPKDGEDYPENEYLTDELRIRYWSWKDHVLLDMNAYPGDTELGVIYLDGEPFLSPERLLYPEDCIVPLDFDIELFRKIRNQEYDNIVAEHKEHNIRIQKEAWNAYQLAYNASHKK